MAEILAVGAYELFPAQAASSNEVKHGAKYVITRYNLTYISPFWNSAGRQDSPKIMSEGYSQIVHYGLSSRSMKYSSASFSSFPENGYFIVLQSSPMVQHLVSSYNNPALALLAALGGYFSLIMAIFAYFKKLSLKFGTKFGGRCCLTKRGVVVGTEFHVDYNSKRQNSKQRVL